ncbi:MAG: alkaline phosphatase D family protein [Kofleriaceae bacterium]
MDPNRRDVLRLAGAVAVVAACGDNSPTKAPDASSGTAIFETSESGFLVSAWSLYAKSASIEVNDQVIEATFVNAQAVAQITGLAPSTAYTVNVLLDDGTLTTHAVHTAPSVDDPRPITIAVSADLDPQSSEFESDIFEQIIKMQPEVFVAIGDVPYCDNGPAVPVTLPAYRDVHGLLRTSKHTRPWFQAMGVHAIYDDHEFRNDWDAMRVSDEPDRYAAAMAAWDEFFPIAPTPSGDGVRYRSFRWGANCECFVLDCRRWRSPNAQIDDADKTMLGAAQKAWFTAAIAASTATFKLIFTSVPLDYGVGVDHWAGFTHEREEILGAIAAAGITGVLFLSGDQHYFAAYSHSHGIREFQVGPLMRGIGPYGPSPAGVMFRDGRFNFGLIDITPDSLRMRGIGPGGDVFYDETLTIAELTPVQNVPG